MSDPPMRPEGGRSPAVEQRAARAIALSFLVATAAGIALLVVYALGGQVQLEGVLLAVSLGGIGLGLGMWGRHLFPKEQVVTEERGPHGSSEEDRRLAEETLESTGDEVTRRKFLGRLLAGALGAFGVAMFFPLRSLGPAPGSSLFRTSWRRGLRLVDQRGNPIRVDTLSTNGVLTVFPEFHTDALDSAAVLVRVDPSLLDPRFVKTAWAPDGNVCYSKICTHAGCPVGLYLAAFHELQCPCHQSAFDVLEGARVIFGPATRALPQLPVTATPDGYLVADGDFPEPVGPGFWNRGG